MLKGGLAITASYKLTMYKGFSLLTLVLCHIPQQTKANSDCFVVNNIAEGNFWGAMPFDMDNDGDVDIVASVLAERGIYEDPKYWYENDGNDQWMQHNISDTYNELHLAAGDLNNDSRVDVVTSGRNGMSWHRRETDDTFTTFNIRSGHDVYKPHVADFDGDGYDDIVVGALGTLIWYRGSANQPIFQGTIPRSEGYNGGGGGEYIKDINAGDIDGDGRPDVISSYNQKLVWYRFNNISGTFEEPIYIGPAADVNVVIGKFDGDDFNDVLTIVDLNIYKISYFSNVNGDGSTWSEVIINDIDRDLYLVYLTVGNFDADDGLELLAAPLAHSPLPVMFQIDNKNEYSTLEGSQDYYLISELHSTDINNDGLMDILFVNYTTNIVVLQSVCIPPTPLPTHSPTSLPTTTPTVPPTPVGTSTPTTPPTPLPTYSPTSSPVPAECGKLLDDVQGDIYSNLRTVDSLSLHECCYECEQDERCQWFSYWMQNLSDTTLCYLFDDAFGENELLPDQQGWVTSTGHSASSERSFPDQIRDNLVILCTILASFFAVLGLWLQSRRQEAAKKVSIKGLLRRIEDTNGDSDELSQQDSQFSPGETRESLLLQLKQTGNHRSIALIGLAFVDFVVDCVFVAELFRASDAREGGQLEKIALLSAVFLAIPMTGNLAFTVNLLVKEFRTQAMRDWFFKNTFIGSICVLLALANPEVLGIFMSGTFGSLALGSPFRAPFSENGRRSLHSAGLIGNFLEDIPHIILQALVVNSNGFTVLTTMALITSVLTVSFGLVRRILIRLLYHQQYIADERSDAAAQAESAVLQSIANAQAGGATEMARVTATSTLGQGALGSETDTTTRATSVRGTAPKFSYTNPTQARAH